MVEYMKEAIKQGDASLSSDDRNTQRNLLSVAYKNVIGAKRSSWRVMSSIENKIKGGEDSKQEKLEITQNYRKKIEKELQEVIDDVIKLLNDIILPPLKDDDKEKADERAFYYKM